MLISRNVPFLNALPIVLLMGVAAVPCLGETEDEPRVERADTPRASDRGEDRRFTRSGPMRGGRSLELSNLLRRDFAHRDMEILAHHLDLHSGQRSILQVLLEEYLVAYETEAEDLQQAIADIEESRRAVREQTREHISEAMRDHDQRRDADSRPLFDSQDEPVVIGLEDRDVRLLITEDFRILTEEVGGSSQMEIRDLSREEQVRVREAVREHFREIDPETREAMRERTRERIERARALRQERREFMQRALEEADEAGLGPKHLKQTAHAFLDAKRTLREQFVEDVLLILNEEQDEQWERVEMLRYRLHELPRGNRPGGRIDVMRMVDELTLASLPKSEAAQVLQTYETELDRALRERRQFLEQADIERAKATLGREFNEQFRTRIEEQRYHSAIEQINRTAIEQLMALCSDPDDIEQLRQKKRETMYPDVYSPTLADRAYQHALDLEELHTDQRSQIASQYDAYRRQVTSLNEQMVESLQTLHEMRESQFAEMLKRIDEGERPRFRSEEMRSHAATHRAIRNERRELIRRQTESLTAVLGDRFGELPESVREPEERSDRRRRRAGGDGDSPRVRWERRRGP